MKRCPICARDFPPEERFCSVHGIPLVEEQLEVRGESGELTGLVLDHRYRLAGVVGKGGMGVVYEAENLRIGRRCAVKVLHNASVSDPKMRMRLFREVQATSRVQHPNVIEIYDYGEDERAGSYLVTEFLEGTPLSKVVRQQAPMPLPFVCKAACQLCAALAATHSAGLIHRDLKPGNVILLPSGLAKVLDFGLIKSLAPELGEEIFTITTEGIVFGTPWYMSPEQCSGDDLDARSDVYSLGVIFYEMLTGRVPFPGEKALEVLDAHRRKPVPLPSALSSPIALPGSVEAVLLKALAKKPADRFKGMTAFMDAFFGIAEEQQIPMGSLELHAGAAVATGDPGDSSPSSEESLTLRPYRPSGAMEQLQRIGRDRMQELVDRTVDALMEVFPRYHARSRQSLCHQIAAVLTVAVDKLTSEPNTVLAAQGFEEVLSRVTTGASVTEAIAAIWVSYTAARPIIREAAHEDLDQYAGLEDELDRALLPFLFRLIDGYVDASQGRLVRLNEQLIRRNEELGQLRQALGAQVRDASDRLVEAESIKARVTESISSGLLLVERGTHRVLLFNRALERLSGLSESSVLGRPVDEVLRMVEGVPSAEFFEQVRIHGEVGLRKLRITWVRGEPKTVYVRGQPLRAPSGERMGTLFTIDDVTEREQIIDCFRRYVSRDVVERILRGSTDVEPRHESRRAAILSASMPGFAAEARQKSPETVVGQLSDYVRAAADAVLQHGGTIERMTADGTLAYFAVAEGWCAAAVAAARDLTRRVAAVNGRRVDSGQPPLKVGVGLSEGEVLVLDAGGASRMVQTVVGEAPDVAETLGQAAAHGEILATEAVAVDAGEDVLAAPARKVRLPGGDETVLARTIPYDVVDLPEPEPITVRGPRPR